MKKSLLGSFETWLARKLAEHPLTTLFTYYTASCFLLSSGGYLLLSMMMPDGWVFGALYRMILYHWAHPFQYIALVALLYGGIATYTSLLAWHRWKAAIWWYLCIVMTTIAMASPLGGVLWKIHDMQAGYFPEGRRFWEDLMWGAMEGIRTGWLVILTSIPYNLLGLFTGYRVTLFAFRLMRKISSGQIAIGHVHSLPSLSDLGIKLKADENERSRQPNHRNEVDY